MSIILREEDNVTIMGEKTPTHEIETILIYFVTNHDCYRSMKESSTFLSSTTLHFYLDRLKMGDVGPDVYDEDRQYILRLWMKNKKISTLIDQVKEYRDSHKVCQISIIDVQQKDFIDQDELIKRNPASKYYIIFFDHDEVNLSKDHPHVIEVKQEMENERQERRRLDRIEYLEKILKDYVSEVEKTKHNLDVKETLVRYTKDELEKLQK